MDKLGKFLKIQRTVNNQFIFTETPLQFRNDNRNMNFNHYDEKLDNSISRARSNIFNIVYYNQFKYFYTQTISSKYDRTKLDFLIKKISEITRNLRRRYPDDNFYYLVIPEYHSDDKSFHVHGFLSSGYGLDSYTNSHGFLSLHHFDVLGWNSISEIRNYDACLKYSGAYITKDLAKQRKVGERLFYASKGLYRSCIVYSGIISQIAPVHYQFKSEYCFKTTISLQDYYNIVTKLDSIKIYNDN